MVDNGLFALYGTTFDKYTFATFYANDELIKKAKELGYFILQRDGDVVITHSENLKVA